MRGNIDNTGRLVRFMLRRERIIGIAWIVILVLFSMAIAPGMSGMFDAEARQNFAASYDNPVMIAMMGPVYGSDNYTSGAMYSGMMMLWMIIAVAVMNVFLVARHTRADEEKGRGEVVRSLPTGRLATLSAVMITAVIENAILALFTGLAIAATGIESMGFAGSMLYGVVLGVSGLVFASITAVFCQLSSGASSAKGLSFLVLGVFYMLRAAGDMYGMDAVSCISPLGLAQRSQVYIENHLWPILILLLEAVAITAVAFKLNSVRDMDQGFIPARPGRKEAKPGLLSSFGLSLRLLRNTMIIWLIVMFALGASYGSIIGNIYDFVGDSPDYMLILGVPKAIIDTLSTDEMGAMVSKYFGVFVASMMSLVCLIPLLSAIMKPRGEEKDGRTEHVLSRVVPRVRYLAGYAAIAYAASVILQFATAVGLYGAASTSSANPFTLGELLKANLAYVPAQWMMISVAVLLIGLVPKASGAIWGYFGFTFVASLMGEIIGLPEWLLRLSPMRYIPHIPFDELTFAPLAVLTAITAALTAVGFIFYRKRDVTA